ncbi:uncharacterized protein ACA1_035410 [Acanthamoeba castellanii str. Neff]|uniref:Uncharacterized protein n=1 Tax=Acanthamoeba castellanii (strain ATCC 30010 / Neff) TaxID=1257118 RepID=L8HCV5_ACACF|nr:uncharacterized protein ACA1_035410 [Acanthamoeba castellanii str. Neff]ELR22211.1 hypothetical protein ACA1_035410 [Acanthamoeba castellanii str. Neff]
MTPHTTSRSVVVATLALVVVALFVFPASSTTTTATTTDFFFGPTAPVAAATYNVSLCQSCALVNKKYEVCEPNQKTGPVSFATIECHLGAGTWMGEDFVAYSVKPSSTDYGFLFFNATACVRANVMGLARCKLHSCCLATFTLDGTTYGGFQVDPQPIPSPTKSGGGGGGGGGGGDDFPVWAIIVIVAGGVGLVLVAAGVGFFLYTKKSSSYQTL